MASITVDQTSHHLNDDSPIESSVQLLPPDISAFGYGYGYGWVQDQLLRDFYHTPIDPIFSPTTSPSSPLCGSEFDWSAGFGSPDLNDFFFGDLPQQNPYTGFPDNRTEPSPGEQANPPRIFKCGIPGCPAAFTTSRRDYERHMAGVHGPPVTLQCGTVCKNRRDNIVRHAKKCPKCRRKAAEHSALQRSEGRTGRSGRSRKSSIEGLILKT